MCQDQDASMLLRMTGNLLAHVGARPMERQPFGGCGYWSRAEDALRARAPGRIGRGWWNTRSIAQGSWEALVIVVEHRCIINVLLEAMRAVSKTNVVQVGLGLWFGQLGATERQPEHAHLQAGLGQQHAVFECPELLGRK